MPRGTKRLRAMLDKAGIEHSDGYPADDGPDWARKANGDRVTTVWPVRDESCEPLTFEEDENGQIHTRDEITPSMALSMAVTALLEHESARHDDSLEGLDE